MQVWDDINNMWCDLTLEAPNFNSKTYRIKPPAKEIQGWHCSKATPLSTTPAPQTRQRTPTSMRKGRCFIRWLTGIGSSTRSDTMTTQTHLTCPRLQARVDDGTLVALGICQKPLRRLNVPNGRPCSHWVFSRRPKA